MEGIIMRSRKHLILGPCATLLGLLLLTALTHAQPKVKLKAETVAAFDAYVKDAELFLSGRVTGKRAFLWADDVPARRLALRRGEILVEGLEDPPDIEGGLLHVWLGVMFVPDAKGP